MLRVLNETKGVAAVEAAASLPLPCWHAGAAALPATCDKHHSRDPVTLKSGEGVTVLYLSPALLFVFCKCKQRMIPPPGCTPPPPRHPVTRHRVRGAADLKV